MKKTVLTLAAMGVVMTSAFAQTNSIDKAKNLFSAKKTQKQASFKTSQKGLPQQAVNYNWDGTAWDLTDTSKMTYVQQGKLASNTRMNSGGFTSKETNEFNQHGFRTISKYFQWNSSDWDCTSADSTVVDYNASNLIDKRTRYSFDGTNYAPEKRVTNTYTSGNLTTQLTEESFGTFWVNEEKMEITYDGNNKPVTAVQYEWDGTSAWVPAMKIINVEWVSWNGLSASSDDIGEGGKIKSMTMLEWNETSSEWDTSMRMTYVYDANGGNVMTMEMFMMGNFVPMMRSHTINDSKGNTIEEKSESFVFPNWKQNWGSKFNHTYDGSDNIVETITQYYDDNTKAYENNSRSVYSDFVIAAGVKSVAAAKLNVYPNPMTDRATINLSGDVNGATTVMVFDNMGRKVQEVSSVSNNVVIERNNLKNGIYFYNVVNNNSVVANGRLVIE